MTTRLAHQMKTGHEVLELDSLNENSTRTISQQLSTIQQIQ